MIEYESTKEELPRLATNTAFVSAIKDDNEQEELQPVDIDEELEIGKLLEKTTAPIGVQRLTDDMAAIRARSAAAGASSSGVGIRRAGVQVLAHDLGGLIESRGGPLESEQVTLEHEEIMCLKFRRRKGGKDDITTDRCMCGDDNLFGFDMEGASMPDASLLRDLQVKIIAECSEGEYSGGHVAKPCRFLELDSLVNRRTTMRYVEERVDGKPRRGRKSALESFRDVGDYFRPITKPDYHDTLPASEPIRMPPAHADTGIDLLDKYLRDMTGVLYAHSHLLTHDPERLAKCEMPRWTCK